MGGAERIAASIATSGNADIDYHVVEVVRGRSAYTRTFLQELRSAGVKCHRAVVPDVRFHFIFERVAALTFPLWFIFLYIKHRPIAIHSHTEVPDMATFALVKLFPFIKKRCRIVRTIHNTRLWTGQKKMGRHIESFFIRNKSNVAISTAVRDSYAKIYGQETPIIYNGVPESQSINGNTDVPKVEKTENEISILFAGRFEEQKGIATLVKIIKEEAHAGSRYMFHLYGDGSLREFIESQLKGCRNVVLNAPMHGLRRLMPQFDYLLMPSEFEGLSTLSIEASMEGLPVIANRCPGLTETLPPDWPLAVDNNDIGEYKHLFRNVIPSVPREEIKASALRYATARFSLSTMRQSYEAIYMSPIGK